MLSLIQGLLCRNVDNQGQYERFTAIAERIDSVVAEDVVLMKMDVEGFEPTAYASAKGLLDGFRYSQCKERD